MGAEIWITVITSLCSLIGVIITVVYGNKLTLYRIEQLEKKQDKHNSLIERVYSLERDEAVIESEIDTIRKQIDETREDIR